MKRSNHTYVLSDDSKYSIKALCTWANLTEFDLVFVNSFPANRKKPKNIVVCET
jgi:DeoR family fructose operon transcriptional repressor